jgi:DNA-binding LacI/PurR family transcriptional regulator
MLAEKDLPVVLGGRFARMLDAPEKAGVSFVDVDNVGGARQATSHLVDTGRRRIATITGPQDMGVGIARLAGYREALDAAGIEVVDDLIGYGDFSEASGMAAMRALLAAHPDIDAVFAASDPMALGVLRVLRDAGRRVPEDIAVVGFDDSVLANQTLPTLTSVHQPVEEMGRTMARLLYDKISGIEPAQPYVILGTHLVERDSS